MPGATSLRLSLIETREMKAFSALYSRLDATSSTKAKTQALAEYFETASPQDAAWAVWFLSGNRPQRLLPARTLAELACAQADIPLWLFEECYAAVGDLAETVALLLPGTGGDSELGLSEWIEQRLLGLRGLDDAARKESITRSWNDLDPAGRFVWNKLITGQFRVGVSKLLVLRALSTVSGLTVKVLSERFVGAWEPTAERYELLIGEATIQSLGQPYPFFLAHALHDELATFESSFGPIAHWLVEWKWDGIRAQLVRRGGEAWLWSRGEELITERFPEIVAASEHLPDGTVLDGELMAWEGDGPLPFALLQKRIGRKTLTPKVLASAPATLVCFDLLEDGGADLRERPMKERRALLEVRVGAGRANLRVSERLSAVDWIQLKSQRDDARSRGVEGLMLKRLDSAYGIGRTRGPWWKWKLEPMSVDAVLVYAQRGHGRRASLYTDYTFAVWDDGALVPFAKAYSGLSDDEIRGVDDFIRRNTSEKFGPVRSVKPSIVCEIGFEGIQRSNRHKSGVAVRFPRILKLRTDKTPAEADDISVLKALLHE